MQSKEIRSRFLKFFERRGHSIIPSASLVPENDPSVLFTTAGMHPLVPYLLGAAHPKGKRLVSVQKCVRTGDIDDIGDNTHATFFEMLGNWSLGDYFKEDAIKWSYEFLTSKEEGLGLEPKRLYVTVFEGDENAPRDEESAKIWKSLGVPENRVYYLPAAKNWWSPGDNGPCGPDSEMFYDLTENGLGDMTHEEYLAADLRQDIVEVWNDVFMEYEKKDGKVIGKLANKNVDTGAGLERLAMVLQKKNNVFDTDLFANLAEETKKITDDLRSGRIVADHIRTAVMMMGDGVTPSNADRGYILRRLIRRAAVKSGGKLTPESVALLVSAVAETYHNVYDNIEINLEKIIENINREINKFSDSLIKGMKEFSKISLGGHVSGVQASTLFTTFGFPIETIIELAKERGITVDERGFREEIKKHQELSRAGAEQKFRGGLADTSEKTVMLHTSTHLMLAGLRKYLGEHVHQAGSNITTERTRFDFTHPEKVPREILDKVEMYVNEAIGKGCAVSIEQIPKEEAQKRGVEGSFWEKYPDVVNVYMVKAPDGAVYSQELCGGPHVENTRNILGRFKIMKEEASSAGVRRIKAVLE
ncbi:MAG: alanine--tRNA ligase [Patescibacteria group bacterium]